jgi:hypothetical protein
MSGGWRRSPLAKLGSFKLNDRRSRIKEGPKVTSNRVPTPEDPANENEASPGVARPGFRAAHRAPADLDAFGLQSRFAPDAAVGTTAYSPHPTPPRARRRRRLLAWPPLHAPTWSIRPPARLSPTHSSIQPRPLTPVLSRSRRCAPGCGIRASSRSHVLLAPTCAEAAPKSRFFQPGRKATMSDTTTQITNQPSTAGVPPTPPEAHQRADEGQGSGRKDFAAQLAFFLLEHTGSVFGTWVGKLSAAGQRPFWTDHRQGVEFHAILTRRGCG